MLCHFALLARGSGCVATKCVVAGYIPPAPVVRTHSMPMHTNHPPFDRKAVKSRDPKGHSPLAGCRCTAHGECSGTCAARRAAPASSPHKNQKNFQKTLDNTHPLAYNNQRTKRDGELCNGSTYDSDSYCLGSNPSSPANGSMVKRLRRRPLKAKSGVRFPLELPGANRRKYSGGFVVYTKKCAKRSNQYGKDPAGNLLRLC